MIRESQIRKIRAKYPEQAVDKALVLVGIAKGTEVFEKHQDSYQTMSLEEFGSDVVFPFVMENIGGGDYVVAKAYIDLLVAMAAPDWLRFRLGQVKEYLDKSEPHMTDSWSKFVRDHFNEIETSVDELLREAYES